MRHKLPFTNDDSIEGEEAGQIGVREVVATIIGVKSSENFTDVICE